MYMWNDLWTNHHRWNPIIYYTQVTVVFLERVWIPLSTRKASTSTKRICWVSPSFRTENPRAAHAIMSAPVLGSLDEKTEPNNLSVQLFSQVNPCLPTVRPPDHPPHCLWVRIGAGASKPFALWPPPSSLSRSRLRMMKLGLQKTPNK